MTTALNTATQVDGLERRYCGARKKQVDGTCRLPAGHGTDHVGLGYCRRHGGNTRSQKVVIEGHIIEARARTMFGKTYDTTPVGNPLEVFAELAGTVRGWMNTMQAMVADLNAPGYAGLTGEQVKAEVQLFERAMDRANTVLSTYARLNIDDRLARITEAQQFMVLQAIEAALSAAGVSGQKAIEAKRAAAKKLRVLENTPKADSSSAP